MPRNFFRFKAGLQLQAKFLMQLLQAGRWLYAVLPLTEPQSLQFGTVELNGVDLAGRTHFSTPGTQNTVPAHGLGAKIMPISSFNI
jgi:hypothetical protein